MRPNACGRLPTRRAVGSAGREHTGSLASRRTSGLGTKLNKPATQPILRATDLSTGDFTSLMNCPRNVTGTSHARGGGREQSPPCCDSLSPTVSHVGRPDSSLSRSRRRTRGSGETWAPEVTGGHPPYPQKSRAEPGRRAASLPGSPSGTPASSPDTPRLGPEQHSKPVSPRHSPQEPSAGNSGLLRASRSRLPLLSEIKLFLQCAAQRFPMD